MAEIDIRNYLGDVPDFPKPGILFKDVQPILKYPEVKSYVARRLREYADSLEAEEVAEIEARGFVFGTDAASFREPKLPIILLRKPDKLPRPPEDPIEEQYKDGENVITVTKHLIKVSYGLEYGKDSMEVARYIVTPGRRVVIVDDLLATGGTFRAASKALRKAGAEVVGYLCVVKLKDLEGEERLTDAPVISLVDV